MRPFWDVKCMIRRIFPFTVLTMRAQGCCFFCFFCFFFLSWLSWLSCPGRFCLLFCPCFFYLFCKYISLRPWCFLRWLSWLSCFP